MMYTSDLEYLLSQDPIIGPMFGGVYPSNQLPTKIPPNKRIYVANTHPANKPGEHWVAFYFTPEKICIYFDSYGLPPLLKNFKHFIERNAMNWIYNTKRLQQRTSTVCGHYCIFFSFHMARGKSLLRFQQMFTSHYRLNDQMVKDFVQAVYKLQPKKRHYHCKHQSCCKQILN